jgi:uncharacterized PurR-regulated membrane protein YhhQ (DUF165 family)
LKIPVWTALYVCIIVLVNVAFGIAPLIANVIVGVGFIVRDLAQREVKDRILWATALGVVLSYLMADKGVAVASAVAFGIAETVDWYVVRRLHDRPMLTRMLVSHLVSVPVDSTIFLVGLVLSIQMPWSWMVWGTMILLKFVALAIIWVFPRNVMNPEVSC